jgi:hypothetical protein
MAALPCCAAEDVEAGSAALRVDWPVYPRRAEDNTVAGGGNRRSTIAASSQIKRSPCSWASFSYPTDPSDNVRAIASNASTVMAMRTMRSSSVTYQADFLARMVTAIVPVEARAGPEPNDFGLGLAEAIVS